jgi:hypothetical protein
VITVIVAGIDALRTSPAFQGNPAVQALSAHEGNLPYSLFVRLLPEI